MATTYSYADCTTHGEAQRMRFCSDRRFRCMPCLESCPLKEWPFKYVKPVQSDTVRQIKVADPFTTTNAKPCNGHCTSGKRSCDCRCNGRCHGAGKCLGGHA